MRNIFLWGWTEADQFQAITILKEDPSVEIVDWVGDLNSLEKSYAKFIYNDFNWHSFLTACHGYELTANELLKFMDMFSREKRSKGLDYHEQINLAKNYFRYFLWLLRDRKVTDVFFSMVPIIGFDYLCYLAAKKIGLATLMCYQSIFPNRFFYCHDLEDFGSFEEIKSTYVTVAPEISWGYKKDLFYMKGAIRMNRQVNPILKFIRETLRYGLRKSSKPMRYSGVIENLLRASEFKKGYLKHAKSELDIDLSAPFVYFPLHLQPELTTSGMGGDFSDQLDAIQCLSELLPEGWRIYAKENPKQGHEQRGREFFNRIASFENVIYLSKEVGTYDLMERCQFVATITGTAGWECITGGKPCLVFGLAWYLKMPGVVSYEPNIELSQIFNLKINRSEQIESFQEIYAKTQIGIMDKVYTTIYPSYNSGENAKNIAIFLRKILNT